MEPPPLSSFQGTAIAVILILLLASTINAAVLLSNGYAGGHCTGPGFDDSSSSVDLTDPADHNRPHGQRNLKSDWKSWLANLAALGIGDDYRGGLAAAGRAYDLRSGGRWHGRRFRRSLDRPA